MLISTITIYNWQLSITHALYLQKGMRTTFLSPIKLYSLTVKTVLNPGVYLTVSNHLLILFIYIQKLYLNRDQVSFEISVQNIKSSFKFKLSLGTGAHLVVHHTCRLIRVLALYDSIVIRGCTGREALFRLVSCGAIC